MKIIASTVTAITLLIASVIFFTGCNSSTPATSTAEGNKAPDKPVGSAQTTPAAGGTEHAHKPGTHGGIIVPIGRESYHAEAVFEQKGVLRLYLLGADESRVQEIERQSLTAYAKSIGGMETQPFALEAEPQEGDAADKTSRFKGTLPEALQGQPVEVTIPNLKINGERFRIGFSTAQPNHAGDSAPPQSGTEKSRQLFLTPGGKYTAADIAANGHRTGGEKFRGFVPTHDLKPNVGDKICPITLTKANPQCTWIVDGKTYEFCCPPCVEEFVKLAKEKPEEIKAPSEYVKR